MPPHIEPLDVGDDDRDDDDDEGRGPQLVLEEGKTLARKYRLVKPAGFGGMAELWVAKNESTAAEVCVKVLVPDASDDESVERFRREAYAAARLSHRAIVRVFDLMELGRDGQVSKTERPHALAIVMELLSGETLSDWLMKRGKLSVDEALDIGIPMAGALAHAHRAGVIHRDIKPDNIFLAKDPDGTVIPKVLDFGVSKIAAAGDAPPLTAAGVVLGTPSFMSPEQAKGARSIDARTDVFSAGIVLYMMLAGKNPFDDDSFHTIIQAILEREPLPIADVPPEIWDVVARALAKNPAQRYRDGTELQIALMKASGRRSLSEPSLVAAAPRVSSDSKISVPPVGTQSIPPGDAIEEALQAAPQRRRRAVRVVVGTVVGLAFALVLVAVIRGQLAAPAEAPAHKAVAAPVAPPPPSAASAATAATARPPEPEEPAEPAEAAEAAEAASASAAPAAAAAPASTVRRERAPKKDPTPAPKEPAAAPSVATDPGF